MRDDMAKVIVERPRYNHRAGAKPKGTLKRWQKVPPEDWWTSESIAPRPRTKWLKENLRPLFRFLNGSVGRPWNKVHQEMSEHVSSDNAVQAHIWTHIGQHVCIKPMVVNGELFSTRGHPLYEDLYVDPGTGILRRNKRPWPRWFFPQPAPTPEPIRSIDMGACRRAMLLDGLWYEVQLAPVPPNPTGIYDAVLRKTWGTFASGRLRELYGSWCYAIRKRQLNSKEIQRIVKPPVVRPLPSFVRNRRR
jgi:hypothetical protein